MIAMVTGGRGILGARLIAELRLTSDDVRSLKSDLTNFSAVRSEVISNKDVTHWFHLAAMVPTDVVEQDLSRALLVNSQGTANLFACIAELRANLFFCYVSSSHVYTPQAEPITEQAKPSPSSLYGLTKLLGEKSVLEIADFFGQSATIARVFSMYDQSQKGSFLYPAWKQKIDQWDGRSELEVLGGNCYRDFSNASEIANRLVNLAAFEANGIFNIGSGRAMKVVDFLKEMFGQHMPFMSVGESNSLIPSIEKFEDVMRRIN